MSTEVEDRDSAQENFEELLGSENVQRLHGNLYRVRRRHIMYATAGVKKVDSGIQFGNPRWVTNNKGKPVARGFERQKMEDLKASIREEGLENPLRLRIIEDGDMCYLQIVNGERRLRSIDSLMAENALCIDPHDPDSSRKPAKELFEWIEVRINRMSEKTALKISLRPNETGESIGEIAAINVVKVLRQNGSSDEEILEITGKSVTWLRETDRLINLDPVSLQALQQEEINRKVALTLTEITDVDKRLQRLEQIRDNALQRITQKEKAIRESAMNDQATAEIESATAKLAELDGDKDDAEAHRQKAAEAAQRAEKKAAEAEALATGPKTATIKDIDATRSRVKDEESEEAPKPWTSKKVEKFWLKPLITTIKNKGLDEDGADLEVDIEDCMLLQLVFEAMLEGKSEDGKPYDIHKILRLHDKRKKSRRQQQK